MERILIGEGSDPASEIMVGRGLLGTGVGRSIAAEAPNRRRVAILSQPGAAATIGQSIRRSLVDGGLRTEVRVIPDRDAGKTLEVAKSCFLWFNELALTRDDLVVGVGGGAVTDLAGFAAALYLRGIDVVHVPTTLLGAVDAAVGGKTGVNIGGKNLVGAFHHPRRVLIDPDVLDALPRELIVEGSAEAVKCGLIADPALVDLYETAGADADLEEVVVRAVRVKAAVVNEDFREHGRRAILNYGHTVGHAIEIALPMAHGHAVAVGMVAAGAAAERVTGFGGAERQRNLIRSLGLPIEAPGIEPAVVKRYMALDKKRQGDALRMTLLEEIGVATLRCVDDATVDRALAAVGIG